MIHYPNGVAIIDENTFVYTNPVMGIVAIADKTTKTQKVSFGGQGIAVGMFGRAVSCVYGDDGLIWITDAMGSNIQAYNLAGEPKLAIGNAKFPDPELQMKKPRSLVVKDGMFYMINANKNMLQAYKYTVTKVEE